MNKERLQTIISEYIKRFDELNDVTAANESYKWFVAKSFHDALDLDVSDSEFPRMLRKAKGKTSNLIDQHHSQPFYSLCKLADKEPATVRSMLKDLLCGDDSSTAAIQYRINRFCERASEIKARHTFDVELTDQNQRAAMTYLWFYDPDKHYYFRSSSSNYFSKALEVYENWGTYDDLQLEIYQSFCEAVIKELRSNDELMAVNKRRFEGNEHLMHPDKNLHILLADIIFCTDTYKLIKREEISMPSASATKEYQQQKAKAEAFVREYEEIASKFERLDRARQEYINLIDSGTQVFHRTLGEVRLVDITDKYITIESLSSGEKRNMSFLNSIMLGTITLGMDDSKQFIRDIEADVPNELGIYIRYKDAVASLEAHQEYLF